MIMEYLLDTRVVLLWFDDPAKLSPKARDIIQDGNNRIYVSSAITWEIAIKHSLKKLQISADIWRLIAQNFSELPITIAHTRGTSELKFHHTDPFDRLLIAQAKLENLTLVTRDPYIGKYPVSTLHA
jgi:PIN domain nuclease of toxin-antitoxin system